MSYSRSVDNLAKALAVLIVEEENYSYIDKLGYAPSKDLALYYLREALRDLHSLIRGGRFEKPYARKLLSQINLDDAERAIENIGKIATRRELREYLSMLASKALAISAKALLKEEKKEEGG